MVIVIALLVFAAIACGGLAISRRTGNTDALVSRLETFKEGGAGVSQRKAAEPEESIWQDTDAICLCRRAEIHTACDGGQKVRV